jgi:hypothetical protein
MSLIKHKNLWLVCLVILRANFYLHLTKKNPASAFKAHIEERQSEREREKSNSKSKLKKQVSEMRNSIAASTNIFKIFFRNFPFIVAFIFLLAS